MTPNALLSSEARYTNVSALLRNHKTPRKPKMPRVPNLLEQFVRRLFAALYVGVQLAHQGTVPLYPQTHICNNSYKRVYYGN